MKKKLAVLLSTLVLGTVIGAVVPTAQAGSATGHALTNSPATSEVISLASGQVSVYDYGKEKLHVYATADALSDVAFIIEGEKALVGLELPAFTADLGAWQTYASSLNKPLNDVFLIAHPTGASYMGNINFYGTKNVQHSIKEGEVFALTEKLHGAFGDDFRAGADLAQVNKVVPAGRLAVAGIEFNIIERGNTYDLEVPSMNLIYTHMLGKTSHSILANLEHIDYTLSILREYQTKGYQTIISSHSGVEGQDAVAEKIAYVEKLKELLATTANATEFKNAVKNAFPHYNDENYLDMTANMLFPQG